MFCENESVESIKSKLKSVTKQKLAKEREVLKLRNKERSLIEELNTTRAEGDYITEQIEVVKNQITQSRHQISMIDICTVSEDLKIETHKSTMNAHLAGFQEMFDKEQREVEYRIKQQKDKEAELLELQRQKECQIAEEKARQQREAAAIEEECAAIERECAVLKKRNTAIMLKLRKRLLEAENTRREVMKRNSQIQQGN
ncbi:inner centromere protein A-like [Trichoplusia ni]|uniref:Inner centromere protein A-like n=1 Tax=Trichoplusia ni TaxID=7111 RepID=A0A7E5WAQ8_TRINI|nr:inner centromere protein A-like [Trichoplusia ni]